MMNTLFYGRKEDKILLQRARGFLEVSFVGVKGETTLSSLYQSGSLKALIPKSFRPGKEAIIINTGGGIVGGDQLSISICGGNDTETWITSQASEKVYKSIGDMSRVQIDLKVGDNSTLYWCPQELILFDRSKLSRTMNFNINNNSNLLIVENIVFGRLARGEISKNCYFFDQWRIKRDQKLVLAENFLFSGRDCLYGKANLGHNTCIGTVIYVSLQSEGYLKQVRRIMEQEKLNGGASCWNNCLVCRVAAEDPSIIKHFSTLLIKLISSHERAIPRVWMI